MRSLLLAALGLGLACLAAVAAGPAAPTFVPPEVRPGAVAVLQLPAGTRLAGATLDGERLPVVGGTGERLLVGLDLEARPGRRRATLRLEGQEGPAELALALTVLPSPYPVQRLTLPRVYTEPDPAALRRIAAEKAVVDTLWAGRSPRLWQGAFRLPLDPPAPLSGFGVRRIINGEPRAPHTGADLSAPAGTPVLASNAGRVVLSADHFFAGNALVLDHGEGLFTMYFHLADALVAEGQRVERGQPIGRVGSTGRASGPHLHWGVRLQGARIDPAELLRATE